MGLTGIQLLGYSACVVIQTHAWCHNSRFFQEKNSMMSQFPVMPQFMMRETTNKLFKLVVYVQFVQHWISKIIGPTNFWQTSLTKGSKCFVPNLLYCVNRSTETPWQSYCCQSEIWFYLKSTYPCQERWYSHRADWYMVLMSSIGPGLKDISNQQKSLSAITTKIIWHCKEREQ